MQNERQSRRNANDILTPISGSLLNPNGMVPLVARTKYRFHRLPQAKMFPDTFEPAEIFNGNSGYAPRGPRNPWVRDGAR